MSQNTACCAHLTVKYFTETKDGLTHGWWECVHGCGARFEMKRDVPLTDSVKPCEAILSQTCSLPLWCTAHESLLDTCQRRRIASLEREVAILATVAENSESAAIKMDRYAGKAVAERDAARAEVESLKAFLGQHREAFYDHWSDFGHAAKGHAKLRDEVTRLRKALEETVKRLAGTDALRHVSDVIDAALHRTEEGRVVDILKALKCASILLWAIGPKGYGVQREEALAMYDGTMRDIAEVIAKAEAH